MEQLKKYNEDDKSFVEKIFNRINENDELKMKIKNISLAYENAFDEKAEAISDDIVCIDFSKYGYDKRIKTIGYFLGTLAALGLRYSRNKYNVSGLMKEKDPLKLLDNILELVKEGRSVFEKKVRYLYDSGKISKETYKKMIDYASIIDKLPVKRKYYENFFTR
ncbi:MAG: hypothetical protein J7K83_03255 [Candidatus Aenigmarchaeota archaeon]|nr:hypothetical protein [Candidatus Aenigmarchaeota archaeon]